MNVRVAGSVSPNVQIESIWRHSTQFFMLGEQGGSRGSPDI